jgi:hypothetical protein
LFLWQLATTEENDVFFFSVCLFVSARVFRFSLSSPSHCCARDRQEGEISVACFPAVFFSFFVPFLFRGLERGTSGYSSVCSRFDDDNGDGCQWS